jgi:hypothetical protein
VREVKEEKECERGERGERSKKRVIWTKAYGNLRGKTFVHKHNPPAAIPQTTQRVFLEKRVFSRSKSPRTGPRAEY